VDQGRAEALADAGHDTGGIFADFEIVPTVNAVDGQPREAAHQLGNRSRRLLGRRDRDRITVVGYDVQEGQAQGARGIEALPELALGGRPLAQ